MSINWDAVIDRLGNGWTQSGGYGTFTEPTGGVCVVGAIHYCLGYGEFSETVNEVLTSPLPGLVVDQFSDRVDVNDSDSGMDAIYSFNDNEYTTLADVIAVCEKARAES